MFNNRGFYLLHGLFAKLFDDQGRSNMSINAKKIYRLTGLSTDVKPIFDDIATGSTFEETDTGVVFVYNTDLGQ